MTINMSVTVIWGYRVWDNAGKWDVSWYCSDGADWHWTNNKSDASLVPIGRALEMMRGIEFATNNNLFVLEFVH